MKMRGQKDLKSMKRGVNWIENQEENWYKLLKICWMIHFGKENRPTLGPSISGTKCDRDNPIFSTERGGQSDCVEVYKIGTQLDWKPPKWGSSPRNLPTIACKGGSTHPGVNINTFYNTTKMYKVWMLSKQAESLWDQSWITDCTNHIEVSKNVRWCWECGGWQGEGGCLLIQTSYENSHVGFRVVPKCIYACYIRHFLHIYSIYYSNCAVIWQ